MWSPSWQCICQQQGASNIYKRKQELLNNAASQLTLPSSTTQVLFHFHNNNTKHQARGYIQNILLITAKNVPLFF